MQPLGRGLILVGALLMLAGLLVYFGPAIPWLGRLPGDLRIERPGVRIYFPISTCILISLLVSGLLALWARLR
jgi:hypothetical protein